MVLKSMSSKYVKEDDETEVNRYSSSPNVLSPGKVNRRSQSPVAPKAARKISPTREAAIKRRMGSANAPKGTKTPEEDLVSQRKQVGY